MMKTRCLNKLSAFFFVKLYGFCLSIERVYRLSDYGSYCHAANYVPQTMTVWTIKHTEKYIGD